MNGGLKLVKDLYDG